MLAEQVANGKHASPLSQSAEVLHGLLQSSEASSNDVPQNAEPEPLSSSSTPFMSSASSLPHEVKAKQVRLSGQSLDNPLSQGKLQLDVASMKFVPIFIDALVQSVVQFLYVFV